MPLHLPSLLIIKANDYIQHDKAERIFSLLSISDMPEDKINYYGENQEIQHRPFIQLSDTDYILFYNNQLLVAIYELLLGLFTTPQHNKSSSLRKNFLEKKVREMFEKLFNNECEIYANYYMRGSDKEKDLLVLHKDCAFVIECKSDRMIEPFRNREKGYIRLKRDFDSSIQKGYEQALEVENAFYNLPIIDICDKNRNKVNEVQTNKYRHVFNIIITQERYGLIQIDLGLLLQKKEEAIYPWSVCVDDLETILITIKRKKEKLNCLANYLINREKLNERVICHDELDLAAHYLMQRADFIRICSKEDIFITRSDVCFFFDDLYNHGGLGFDNELNLEPKFHISIEGYLVYELCKKLQLRDSEVISLYKKENHIDNNKPMFFFGERIMNKPTEINKRFMRSFQGKSIRWDSFIHYYNHFIERDGEIPAS